MQSPRRACWPSEAICRALAGHGIRVRLLQARTANRTASPSTARRDVDASIGTMHADIDERAGYPMLATDDPAADPDRRTAGDADGVRADSFEIQTPTGICRGAALVVNTGASMRVYVPDGGDWYAYLVRRLAERPRNLAFFLRSLRSDT